MKNKTQTYFGHVYDFLKPHRLSNIHLKGILAYKSSVIHFMSIQQVRK